MIATKSIEQKKTIQTQQKNRQVELDVLSFFSISK